MNDAASRCRRLSGEATGCVGAHQVSPESLGGSGRPEPLTIVGHDHAEVYLEDGHRDVDVTRTAVSYCIGDTFLHDPSDA